jgi:hypothetical protein
MSLSIKKLTSILMPESTKEADEAKERLLPKQEGPHKQSILAPNKGSSRSTLVATANLLAPQQELKNATRAIGHSKKGQTPDDHSLAVKTALGNLMGEKGIQYAHEKMPNGPKHDTDFHFSQHEKQFRSMQNEALKTIEKGFDQMTPRDRHDFLENHYVPHLSKFLVSKNPGEDAQLQSIHSLGNMLGKVTDDAAAIKIMTKFAGVLPELSDFNHNAVGTRAKIGRQVATPAKVLLGTVRGGLAGTVKAVEQAGQNKGLNAGIHLLDRRLEPLIEKARVQNKFNRPDFAGLSDALEGVRGAFEQRQPSEAGKQGEQWTALKDADGGHGMETLEGLIKELEHTGGQSRIIPLSDKLTRTREHLEKSSIHMEQLKQWKANNKSVFEGHNSAEKREALEKLMNTFCRAPDENEKPASTEGKAAYAGLCSAQKETLNIIWQQFPALSNKDQVALTKTLIDQHLSKLGSAGEHAHDPQLRGIALVRAMANYLGNRHEDRAQILSRLLLKVNENDLSTEAHANRAAKAKGAALVAGGIAATVANPLFIGFGFGAVAKGVKLLLTQNKAVNAGIKLVDKELQHARKNEKSIKTDTKRELETNFATMLTHFKKDDSQNYGRLFTNVFGNKYKNPENFEQWNGKTKSQKFMAKFLTSQGMQDYRRSNAEKKRDALIEKADQRLNGTVKQPQKP